MVLHRGTTRKKQSSKKASALDFALAFAREGTPVIWIPARSKAPTQKEWQKLATTNEAVIRTWARQHPSCNFGLLMGGGFVAIDIDDPSVIPALKSAGLPLLPTRLVKTPGGGLHFIYSAPLDAPIKNGVNVLRSLGIEHIDIRAKGGQIVCAGSTHPNGGVYKVIDHSPIAPLPDAWQKQLTEERPSATTATNKRGKIGEGERNNYLASVAGSLRARGLSGSKLLAQLLVANGKKCDPPLSDDEVKGIARSYERYPVPDNVAALLNDSERKRIMLPTDNRLLGAFATELGEQMRGLLYRHGRDVVIVERGVMRVIGAQELRTIVERRVICCRSRATRGGAVDINVTMSAEDARGVLASPQFLAALDGLKNVASCSLPAMRADKSIDLLAPGYDAASQTITLNDVEYANDMPFDEAVAVVRDLFSEFTFADKERSLAVAVSALVGLYAAQLPPATALRPVHVYTKNAEGAGGTTCAACGIVPVLGDLPTGAKPNDDEEMRKLLTSSLRAGNCVIFLDNVKNTLGGGALEAFTSATTWSDRVLGSNELTTLVQNATVRATANGARFTSDMRRRSLVCELHLEDERAEDRKFKRPLTVAVLKSLRSQILSACWSLVHHWDEIGRPQPSRSHSAFPEWAAIIGGIVEAAGFGCALDTPETLFAPDEDGQAMRVLADTMKLERRYSSPELYALCRTNGIFTHLVGTHDALMDKSALSTMGRLLARYNNRLVGDVRFLIEGVGHARRFFTTKGETQGLHGHMVKHGVSSDLLKTTVCSSRGKDHADHATMQHRRPRKFNRQAAKR